MYGRARLAIAALAAITGCASAAGLVMPRDEEDPWMYGVESSPVDDDRDSIRFAAVGDVGDASLVQASVAAGVTRACAGRCDFVLLLGDNLYPAGIAEPEDAQTLACLVGNYPTEYKYLVLGNHDYIIDVPRISRARKELAWIRADRASEDGVGARGRYHFYGFRAGPARLVGLDTNFLVRGRIDESYSELARWLGPLRSRDGDWTIVFGHHPYVSNGAHGDAGSYLDGGFPLWPAAFFQHFMRKHVIGRADLYIAGHDHNLQFFARPQDDGTAQVVSGSGARCTPRGTRATDRARLEHYGFGFSLIDAERDRLQVTFYDYDGRRIWGAWRTRQDASWRALDGMPASRVETASRCGTERERMAVRTPKIQPCED